MKNLVFAVVVAGLLTVRTGVADEGATTYETASGSSGETIPFAVHLPSGFDKSQTYPVLIGPGDGIEGADAGFYWPEQRTQQSLQPQSRSLFSRLFPFSISIRK